MRYGDKSFPVPIRVLPLTDTTPPGTSATLSPPPNDNDWNNADVTVALNAEDIGLPNSGVSQITYSASGAQTIASTTVAGTTASFIITAEGVTNVSYFATDNAGNVEATNTLPVKLDRGPPAISIATPAPGTPSYVLNQAVAANYSCTDSLSGVATCAGPVANGQNLDTATAGSKQFTVNATDNAGNASSSTANYTVTASSGSTPAVIVQVQQASNGDVSGVAHTSFSATFAGATTSGNAIILGLTYGNTDPAITVTDSQGNAYAQAIRTYDLGHNQGCAIFYATNITGGASNTVTVNFSAPVAYVGLGVHEYSGVAATAALDGTAGNLGAGTSLSSGSATTTANGDLIFGCGVEDSVGSGDTFTPGSGFTKRVDLGSAAAYADEDQIQALAGPIAATWILSPSGLDWIANMAAFKPVQ